MKQCKCGGCKWIEHVPVIKKTLLHKPFGPRGPARSAYIGDEPIPSSMLAVFYTCQCCGREYEQSDYRTLEDAP